MFSSRKRNLSLKQLNPQDKKRGSLPAIAEHRDAQRSQAKELGYNVQRFQAMVRDQEQKPNQESLMRMLYYLLRNFAEVDNNFKSLFEDVHTHLKGFLFVEEENELTRKYKIRAGMSYKKAVRIIDSIGSEALEAEKEKFTRLEQQKQAEVAELKELIAEAKRVQEQLHIDLERYKQLSDKQYVMSLQKRIEDLKEALSNQEMEYKILVGKNEEISEEVEKLRREVAEFEWREQELEGKIYELNVFKEKSEIYLLKTKERFEDLNSRLEGMKNLISKVEAQNELLVSERAKLVNRAAVAFTDLTPRPKYDSMFTLEEGVYIKPTNEAVTAMIEDWSGDREDLFKKYFRTKKNRKLLECEAIRVKTIDDLGEARGDMEKLSR